MVNNFSNCLSINAVSVEGQKLTASFLPEKGMNLMSYTKGGKEIIDQTTRVLFNERYAGLGAMIGPHFHHRNLQSFPPIKNEALFPHIARVKLIGVKDPFSHGIGRYAPWQVEFSNENTIIAVLNGEQIWNGNTLKELEGQNFKMCYQARLLAHGLEIELDVRSEKESVIGLHTYYALGSNSTRNIICRVQDHYIEKSILKPISSTWNYSSDHTLFYPLDQDTDIGFHPFPDSLQGDILLDCDTHKVKVQYACDNAENSFQIWHPLHSSFACIEPLSAKDPRNPKLSMSRLKILISIL